jgi:lipoprotein-anchoring transpeptidase ErfK/SrfK
MKFLVLFFAIWIQLLEVFNSQYRNLTNTISQQFNHLHLKAPLNDTVHYRGIKMDFNILALNQDSLRIICELNRVDIQHLRNLDTVIVPNIFYNDFNKYAPFPITIRELIAVQKIIFFSNAIQAFAAYENGQLMRWGAVSMGKYTTPTKCGLFHTNWKSKRTISTVNKSWILKWYFNIDNLNGISVHQYAMPGYPASHACIRLLEADAHWFYKWADEWLLSEKDELQACGTPVVIFGNYPFGKRKPWLGLIENSNQSQIDKAHLLMEIAPYFDKIIERQSQRDSIQNRLYP